MIAAQPLVAVHGSIPRARAAVELARDDGGLRPVGHGVASFDSSFQHVLGAFDNHPRIASARAGPATIAMLEPPGLLARNYGLRTPVVAVVAHLAYGTLLGFLLSPN